MFIAPSPKARPAQISTSNVQGGRRLIHTGWYTTTYLQTAGSVKYVVKVSNPGRDVGDSRAAIRREARVLEMLQRDHPHPCIVEFFEMRESMACSYLAEEYVEGQSLDQRLFPDSVAEPRPLSLSQALWVTFCIAWALVHIHEKGLVHRDLKPENVYLGPIKDSQSIGFEVKVGDFAFATEEGGEVAGAPSGMVFFSAGYFHFRISEDHIETSTRQRDFCALGYILYEALTGRRAQELSEKERGRRAGDLWAAIDRECERFPEKVMAMDRPPEVRELVNRLTKSNGREGFAEAREIIEYILSLPEQMRS